MGKIAQVSLQNWSLKGGGLSSEGSLKAGTTVYCNGEI